MKMNTGIKQKDREQVAALLQQALTDTYALRLKAQNYHWNITGPHFGSLHALFEVHYDEMAVAVDEMAERIRALGVKAEGGIKVYAKKTKIDDGNAAADWETMVKDLVKGHETVIDSVRAVLPAAEAAGDEVTVDMMVGRLTAHEKAAWMLRSHLSA
jgi:starvation-inducible DNA-binding protein